VAQAERRLRDAALELGPYGAERQQRAVEVAMRDLQDQLSGDDLTDVDLAVSQLQEALYGLNRRLAKERSQDSNPLQGLKNTLGSLKDELFADDDWDDWDRGRSRDPWSEPGWGASGRSQAPATTNAPATTKAPTTTAATTTAATTTPATTTAVMTRALLTTAALTTVATTDRREDNRRNSRFDVATAGAGNTPRQDPFEGDPWAED